jgi:hypothetical protein
MGQREQKGHLYKAFGGWHIRYWVSYRDLTADEKEKITRKCGLSKKACAEPGAEIQAALRWGYEPQGCK